MFHQEPHDSGAETSAIQNGVAPTRPRLEMEIMRRAARWRPGAQGRVRVSAVVEESGDHLFIPAHDASCSAVKPLRPD